MRFYLSFALVAALSSSAQAQDKAVNVAVYAPSLFFADAGQKADFMTKVEAALTEAIGAPVTAMSVSDPGQLSKEALWLSDASGVVNSSKAAEVLQATRGGEPSIPIGIYGRAKWPSPYALLTGGKVLMPGGSKEDRLMLQYWLLMGEPRSSSISDRVKGARDARAALSTVAAGEGDGVLAYRIDYEKLDSKLSSLKELTFLGRVPLPVLAINTGVVDKATADAWRGKLAKVKLPSVPGVVDGWRGASKSDAMSRVSDAIRRRSPVSRDFVLADLPPLLLDLAALLPPAPEATPLNPNVVAPPARYLPLPDFPTESARPAVAQAQAER